MIPSVVDELKFEMNAKGNVQVQLPGVPMHLFLEDLLALRKSMVKQFD